AQVFGRLPQLPLEFSDIRRREVLDPQHGAHGSSDANGRGAANSQAADCLPDFLFCPAIPVLQLRRQQRLVDQANVSAEVADPGDGPGRAGRVQVHGWPLKICMAWSWSLPLLAITSGRWTSSAPSQAVKRPPASSTIGFKGAMSQTWTPCSTINSP